MADRDESPVPITTLAGLASLSDLLCELPISDSFNTSSPNKSLLFHPRVAEEAKILLSKKDDNITRQLVHAIEHTNADHIELKSQYADLQTPLTNISDYPALLQAIHTLKPTVFKAGGPQHQRQLLQTQTQVHQQQTPTPPPQNIYQPQQLNVVQPNQFFQPTGSNQTWNQQVPNQSFLIQQQQQQLQQQHIIGQPQQQQQQPVIVNQFVQPNQNDNRGNLAQQQHNQLPQTSSQYSIQQQQLQQPQTQHGNAVQPLSKYQSMPLPLPIKHEVVVKEEYPAPVVDGTPIVNIQQSLPVQRHPVQPHPVQQLPVQQLAPVQQHPVQQLPVQQMPPVQQHPAQPIVQRVQQQPEANQHSAQQPTVVHNPVIQSTPYTPINQTDIQSPQIIRTQPITPKSAHHAVQSDSISTTSVDTPMQPSTVIPTIQHSNNAVNQQQSLSVNNKEQPISAIANSVIIENSGPSQQTPKMAPRNSDFINRNPDVRGGPSPAQASDAPEPKLAATMQSQRTATMTSHQSPNSGKPAGAVSSNHMSPIVGGGQNTSITPSAQTPTATAMPSTLSQHLLHSQQIAIPTRVQSLSAAMNAATTSITNSSGTHTLIAPKKKIRVPVVKIHRLKPNEITLMERSITEFTEKQAQIARKFGLIADNASSDLPDIVDMFSKMKALEKRGLKRNINYNDDDDDDKMKFSQPKLRRISMKPVQSSKSIKEDATKSATYQQFLKTMEHELRRLEETEQPNNIEDLEYCDCIPSKILSQLSNDVAKLKAKGVVDQISQNKLTLLINFAMRNIDVAKNCSAGPDIDEDLDDVIDKILDAAEACLLICNIYSTAKDVQFLQEDNMDKITKFVQVQMRETIFPSYDPVFTVKNIKKDKAKKKSSGLSRNVQLLYTKLVDLTKIFVTLFDKCSFVDTIVLAVSTLAVEPFFVDNIETLQFACLELVTTIFRKENYVKYRSSILNDILTSIERLPCSKKNLRPYKLANNGGSIQIITALVLQLIQCSTVLPAHLSVKGGKSKPYDNDIKLDRDLLILQKHDTALNIGGNFLTTFLHKCKSRPGDTDLRPLFENFIYDLLTTVNKPEWPASELLLSLLGRLLVKYMSDKSIEQAIRVISLEYLGIVAARLRKDTVEARCKVATMDALIKSIKIEQAKEGDKDNIETKFVIDPEEERTEFLQKILLDFLAVHAQEDNLVWDYARHFYLTQWYKDVIERKKKIAEGDKTYASRKKVPKRKKIRNQSDGTDNDADDSSESDDDDDEDVKMNKTKAKENITDQELNLEIFRLLENRKTYFLSKITPYTATGITPSGNDSNTVHDIKTYIDYSNAHLIAQYLASKRIFSKSFDIYLHKIVLVVWEPSIAIRTKAMKCLAMIVEVDPSVLMRKAMQMGVQQKFLDTSISVREAAVDLVGKYVLSSPYLIDQYYDMLSKRILDTGVSVRKRVIKILRDICIEYPDFDKIPEICVKMIRRVNDEEGIQKLVTEVFMRMWFTPCADNDEASIERKIHQMSDVVSMAHDTGTQWLDGLLKSIFAPKEDKDLTERNPNAPKKEPPKEVIKACQQLTDGLVNAIIRLEGSDSRKVLGCITTLNLLAKVRPLLLVKHTITLEPYLNIKGNSHDVVKFICFVAEIIEVVVPLMEHPGNSFLVDLESHLMILICSQKQMVVLSCVSCLGAVVNRITNNYALIRDCFARFYEPILQSRHKLEVDSSYPLENLFRVIFRRGIFTIGLLFRYFDFKSPFLQGLSTEPGALPPTICNDVFENLLFFATLDHNDIRREAIVALGHFCIRNYEFLTDKRLKTFYCSLLSSNDYSVEIKISVLRNINMYLHDADQTMSTRDKDWKTQSLVENLCDMNDVLSGMSSRIIQLYLRDVLNSLLHMDFNVRLFSMKVVQAVLRQGLVHPVQIVPYLICLSTDDRKEIAHRADVHLQELDKKYPGFVNMKCHVGIQLSFQLQRILQSIKLNDSKLSIVRGYTVKEKGEQPTALNGFLYSLLRSTKPQRRALVQSITKQFDEHQTSLHYMLYLADNLAYFPYAVQDEPLYIIHQIDLLISCTGTSILQTFKENLIPKPKDPDSKDKLDPLEDDDDDEDRDAIICRLPENTSELQNCITSAQGCILLLVLKQHLKTCYKLTEGKISRYSPSESAKIYEKSMQRHTVSHFNPTSILAIIKEQNVEGKVLTENERKELVDRYLEFKQLMLKIDKEESDDDSDRPVQVTPVKSVANTQIKGGTVVSPTDESSLATPHVNNVIPNAGPVLPNKENAPVNSHLLATAPSSNQRLSSVANAQTISPKSRTVKQSPRKQPSRSKRKKRRVMSSSDESDYSDEDYA